MAFTAPKGTTFKPQGEPRNVTIQPVSGGDGHILTAEYGLIVKDEGGEIAGSRFVVSLDTVVLGNEVKLSAGSTDIKKAVEMFIAQNNLGSPDDFAITYDEEDEFFKQAFKKATVSADDVWTNPKFAENREALNALRGETEGLLETAREAETATQDDHKAVATTLVKVYDMVGRSRAALATWANGAGEGDNLNLLTQLGKGTNALTEAMRLAQISDNEYEVLPASVTSGKAVDRHIAVSIKELVDASKQNRLPGLTYDDKGIPNADGVEALLRQVAANSFGIVGAAEKTDEGVYDMPLSAIVEAVDERAAEWMLEFQQKFGKHVNTYNKDQYAAAKRAYGAVRVSTDGAGLFASAVQALIKHDEADTDEAKAKVIAGLFTANAGNALVKEAANANRTYAETVAKERRNRDIVQSIADDSVISKAASTSFAKLEPLAAAAHLYKLLKSHSKAVEVEAALKSLIAQGPMIKSKSDDSADATADVAE